MSSFFDRLLGNRREGSSQEPAPIEYKNEGRTGEEKKKVKLFVHGRVQGVGFRYSTKQVADELSVGGKVRNEMDGTVYIEAIGSKQQIDSFIEAIRRSPAPSGVVSKVIVEEDGSIEDSANFSISN